MRVVGDRQLTQIKPRHVTESQHVILVHFKVGCKLGLQLFTLNEIQVLFHIEIATIIFKRVIVIKCLLDESTEVLTTENKRLQSNVLVIPEVEV